jgi:hypothetical protein
MGRHCSHDTRSGRARLTQACAAAIADCGTPRRPARAGRLLWMALAAWWVGVTAAREAGLIPEDWRSALALVCGTIGLLSAIRLRRHRLQKEWRATGGRMAPVLGNPDLPATSAQRLDACEARIGMCSDRIDVLFEYMELACRNAGVDIGGGSRPSLEVLPGGKAG